MCATESRVRRRVHVPEPEGAGRRTVHAQTSQPLDRLLDGGHVAGRNPPHHLVRGLRQLEPLVADRARVQGALHARDTMICTSWTVANQAMVCLRAAAAIRRTGATDRGRRPNEVHTDGQPRDDSCIRSSHDDDFPALPLVTNDCGPSTASYVRRPELWAAAILPQRVHRRGVSTGSVPPPSTGPCRAGLPDQPPASRPEQAPPASILNRRRLGGMISRNQPTPQRYPLFRSLNPCLLVIADGRVSLFGALSRQRPR